MQSEAGLIGVAAAVADGTSVDWPALERSAADDHDLRMVRSLRVLAQVGDLYNSLDEPLGSDTTTMAADSIRNRDSAEAAITRAGTATLPSDQVWGRYELRERIGEGGQGAVYRAWDPQLECEVALKVVKPELAGGDRVGERMLREGRALARVRHPHVVNVYGAETHEGQIGLCMEFIRGRTLEDLLSIQGPFGADEAVTIGISVGRALAAVHAAGIIHRDVKARNVMREEKGRIVLMDFGTGRDHAQLAHAGPGDLAGTPLYMAPEVLFGSPASQQSDIYSAGVLLYHLVTSRYPVEGDDFWDILQRHRARRRTTLAERRPDLPTGFIRVVDRATSPDPASRYESVAMLVHDLVALESVDVERVIQPARTSERLLVSSAVLGASLLYLLLLGFFTSVTFHMTLERNEVASESPMAWFMWGFKSLIGPLANLVQLAIVAGMFMAVWRFARRLSSGLKRWGARAATRISHAGARLGWSDPDAFGHLAFVLALVYLAIVWRMHATLITAFFSGVSTLTPEQLGALSTENTSEHNSYRSALDFLVLGTGLAMYRLMRLRRERRSRGNVGVIIAMGAMFLVATFFWVAPYRLLYQADHRRLDFAGQRCYNLGKRELETLIYCPDGPQPKVRRVRSDDPRIHDTGITESVFTPR